ncbi:P27 family predicted phage terminase small subunit [Tepidamorphus gemmatus]|uniref:P27 family predicted phage terminase small subunit n=1 Tax=Tepidamorphus gemmatus TaxID=747076 RepID=A0A4R3MFN1_9HYPH|nr:phage terminase small subunit P27 family [Tepidamorphus gemmatus]TCT12669.1 P27 family predicted phage terminase small subunit [Tepidamorphus gemmatus]
MTRGRKPDRIVTGSNTVAEAPRAPAWLSKDAKTEWNRVAPILTDRRTLTEADLGTLESYCTATGTVREMQRILNRDGAIVDTDKGPKRHPALGVQNAAMTTARLCAAELGLTPVSRSRPAIRDEADDDDVSDLGL